MAKYVIKATYNDGSFCGYYASEAKNQQNDDCCYYVEDIKEADRFGSIFEANCLIYVLNDGGSDLQFTVIDVNE